MYIYTFCFIEKNLVKGEKLKAMLEEKEKMFKDIPFDSEQAKKLQKKTQILLLTANEHEHSAALVSLDPYERNLLPQLSHFYGGRLNKVASYTFGRFGAFNAAVQMMTTPGAAAAQEAITMAADCFGHSLNAIFSVGVACGVEDKNKFLDVLVSTKVTFYNSVRQGTEDGKPEIRSRDIANLPTSDFLLQKFNLPPNWPNKDSKIAKRLTKEPEMKKGLLLSGNVLVDNKKFKDELLKNFAKDAIGIEMEGAGLYHDYRHHSYEILIVKSVCDFGDGNKNKDYQPTAALLAVECLQHYLSRENMPKDLSAYYNKKGKFPKIIISY